MTSAMAMPNRRLRSGGWIVAAAIGAGAGALAGGLSGLLAKHGVSDEDATYYEERINSGGVFLSVDTSDSGIDADRVREILYRNGGHNSSQSKMASTTV